MDPNPLFYKNILDNLHEGVYFVDESGAITYWNKGAERITGYAASEVVGRNCGHNILNHVDAKGLNICEIGCPLAATKKDGNIRERELFLLHKEGHRLPIVVKSMPYYDEVGKIIGAVEIFYDNTKQMQLADKMKQLAKFAFNDEATGATNKRYGEMKLISVLDEVKNQGLDAGILTIELREVKNNEIAFNSELDADTLNIIAKTIMANVQEGDTVSRWGKNSFLLILRNNRKSTMLLLGEKFRSLILQTKLPKSFKGSHIYAAIGGTSIKMTDKVQSVAERAMQYAQISLELQGNKITIDP